MSLILPLAYLFWLALAFSARLAAVTLGCVLATRDIRS